MAISRCYPSHFFKFCEKKRAFSLWFYFFLKKDATFYENTSFLLYLLISVSRQVNRPDSRPDSRPVSRPVSRPICLNIFPKWIGPLFSFFSPFWLSSTLSHPMAIFSANEIRTFFLYAHRTFFATLQPFFCHFFCEPFPCEIWSSFPLFHHITKI